MKPTQLPPFIEALNQQLSPQSLAAIHDNSPDRWAKPLSFTLNDKGQVIALNLQGAGLTQLPPTADWQHLQRLNISHNAFAELVFDTDLPELELLEASYNTVPLERLVFATDVAKLRYLYVYGAALVDIVFHKGLPQPLVEPDLNINLAENNLRDDRLRGILAIDDEEQQRKELISYFKALTQERITIKRAKLIFLGNTEAGKTTLYDCLKNDTKAAKGSTHGINHFSYHVKDRDQQDIRVQGFDFGGQDYYHSTHAPFFSNNALYILVWGNGQKDAFDKNKEGDHLFPLDYWLGSVEYFDRDREDKKSIANNPAKIAPDHLNKKEILPETIENRATIAEDPPSTGRLTNTNKRLYLLQNVSAIDPKVIPLNSRDIQYAYSFANGNGHFCFTESDHKENITAWVNEKIIDFAQTDTVPKVDEEVERLFKNHNGVLFKLSALARQPEVKGLTLEECTHLAKRLHRNLSCYYLDENELTPTEYPPSVNDTIRTPEERSDLDTGPTAAYRYDPLTEPEKKQLSSTIIINLEVFTDWIYAILAKELTNHGYFTHAAAAALLEANEELAHRPEAQENLSFILAFMLHHRIIFRIEDKDRYIAPNYLPHRPDKAAELLLGTFEPALVKYQFTGFFHTNIMTEMLARFFDHLLVSKDGDQSTWKYLLWKNKVLLYEKPADFATKGDHSDTAHQQAQAAHSKKLLYIHFEFPDPSNKESVPLPTISIHRFAKNHVSDQFLKQVMGFIEHQIDSYRPQKMVITPSLEYIPYKNVIEKIKQDGQDCNLVYHDGKIYRKGDFNLFLDDKDKSSMKRIFISYSKDDLPMVNQFLKHLAPLQRSGLIERWYCTELMAGSDWDATIQAHFDAADIVCFMVSPQFNATDYIYDYELKKAFERKKQPGAKPLKIVPIIMKYCIWTIPGQYNLGQYTALPYTAKPVADFHDPDMAWLIVTEGIRILCQHYDAVEPTGEDYYKDLAFFNRGKLGKQLLGFFERIVQGKVDNNA